jgi:MFS family permease
MTLVTEVVPPAKRKSAIVLSRLAINLGLSIGPALAGFIVAPRVPGTPAERGQFLALFLIDAGANLATALILWMTRLPRGEHAQVPQPPRAGLLADPRLRLLFIATTLNAIVFWQIESSFALYLKEHLHLAMTLLGRRFESEEIYGLTITLNGLMIVLLEVELNLLTHRWPQRRTLVVGALLVAIGFGGMAIAHGVPMIALNVALFTFGEMFLMPAVATYAISIAPPLRRGSYMGVVTLCFGTGFAIGPWLGTNLLARCGPVVLWSAALLVGCASAWCYSRLDEPPPSVEGEEAAEVAAA